MLTKYILHISGEDYELREDDLRNWAEVRCSYSRADFGGVVRSFTSQFEFVNEARRMLLSLYLRDGFAAEASVCVQTMTSSWTYEKRFECRLDFSTVSWDGCTLKINAVDGSAAAMLKANRSTKFEFAVGRDIVPDMTVRYDRVPMIEYVRYAFTQGTSFDDSAGIVVRLERNVRPWVGMTDSDVTVNQSVYFTDDQEDNDQGFLLRAEQDVMITFDSDLEWRTDYSPDGHAVLGLRILRGGALLPLSDTVSGDFCPVGNVHKVDKGTYHSYGSLPEPPLLGNGDRGWYATVGGIIYELRYNGSRNEWKSTGKTYEQYFRASDRSSLTFEMLSGDKLVLVHTSMPENRDFLDVCFLRSSFTFTWQGTGEYVDIGGFSPVSLLKAIVRSATGRGNAAASISDHDDRIAGTCVMAAESLRGINGAKLYTSFGEFCDWMSAVFGYVHTVGSEMIPEETVMEGGGLVETPYSYSETFTDKAVSVADVLYFPVHGRFLARNPETGGYHAYWPYHERYNDSEGHVRTDRLFRLKDYSPDSLCRFGVYNGTVLYPVKVGYTEDDLGTVRDMVRFVHRSELFGTDAEAFSCDNAKDIEYSVDTGAICSAVTAGYDRKEYSSINGRDEFNFSNTYSTGCSVSDRTLSLVSKYRADSYGIEFAVQKRGDESTDSDSDKDVFFMLVRRTDGRLYPDRTVKVSNSVSGRLFNGAFSPMACIRANAGLIGLQAPVVELAFASSTANSDIEIDGEPMTADITLDTPLATCGTVEFSMPGSLPDGCEGRMVSVTSEGITYRGFLKEADTVYAREETTAVKMIVKEVQS